MNKRQTIERAIIDMIREEIVLVGKPVPSIKKMATRYGISVTPVIEAYRNLEQHRILKSRPRSGFVVATSSLSVLYDFLGPNQWESGSNGLKSGCAASDRADNASETYDFNYATLTPPMTAYDSIIQHIISTLRTSPHILNENIHGYDDPLLVDSVVWCMSHYQCITKKSEICITNNDFTLPLVYALRSCLQPGQAVLLTSPCDKCHVDAVRRIGHEIVFLRNTLDGLDLNALERMLVRKPHIGCIIVSPNFQQPSGISMSSENRRMLVAICQKHNICIIEDDRTRYLAFNNVCPLPIKSATPDNTIYIQSLSFPVMPNMQMHWTCPGKYTNEFRAHRNHSLASPPAFIQRSFGSYMTSHHKKDIFAAGKKLAVACSQVKEAIAASFPSKTYISSPNGGCFLWVELPEAVSCTNLADEANAIGIKISVGYDYNFQGNWIVINYSTVAENHELVEGIYKLGALACKLADRKGEG